VMFNEELMDDSGYSVTYEMFTLITGPNIRASKPSDYVLKTKHGHNIYREISD
jgi:hypothetical protein